MMSEMPRTPWRRTSSATRKASVTGSEASTASRRLRARERGSFLCFLGKRFLKREAAFFSALSASAHVDSFVHLRPSISSFSHE